MSLNRDQEDYVRYLASLPPEQKCECRWYRRGECPNCTPENGGRKDAGE